jgi:hypothetical protein
VSLLLPLGLLAAALAVPLTLWYVLRPRRPRVDVSSTYLWRRSGSSVTAAMPWQRFRPDRTFWLVLAALLIGAVALARPALPVDTPLGAHTIVIMDASASMLADEDGPNRLELARRQAEAMIADLGPGQTVSVIRAAERATVLISGTADASSARDTVRTLTPSQGAADLDDALTLAAALEQPGQPTVVHLLSDHAPDDSAFPNAPDDLRVTAVGSDRDNLAVTRIQAVPSGGVVRVFAQVRNFGVAPVEARLRIAAGGQELASRQMRLAPRAHEDVVVDSDGPTDAHVIAASVSAADGRDALSLDDTAYATVAADQQRTALVAGPGNVFVEQALVAAGVEVRTAPLVPDDLRGLDLLVVDRVPAPERPATPTIALAPTRPPAGVTEAPPVQDPVVTFQQPEHPLLTDVDLSQLAIATATPVESSDLAPIVSGPDGALIAAGRIAGQPVVHVGFDLLASTLPLDIAWPVLVTNAVQWLTGATAAIPTQVGAPLPLTVPAGATGIELIAPDDSVRRLDPADPPPRADQVGVWQAHWTGVDAPAAVVAVNPAPAESDLVAVRPTGAATGAGTAVGRGLRVFGPGIAAAMLALLLVEWVLAAVGRRPRRVAVGRRTGRRGPLRRPRRRSRSRPSAAGAQP